MKQHLPQPSDNSLHVRPSSMHQVNQIATDTRNGAAGSDFPSLKVTSLILPVILRDFVSLINGCLKEGEFPDHLKKARVALLHKDRSDFNNYRPI